jgi:hypothetical protein
VHHKPLVEGTDDKRKSQGMALFITLCGEMYLVIRDESRAVCFFSSYFFWDGGLLETLQEDRRK